MRVARENLSNKKLYTLLHISDLFLSYIEQSYWFCFNLCYITVVTFYKYIFFKYNPIRSKFTGSIFKGLNNNNIIMNKMYR